MKIVRAGIYGTDAAILNGKIGARIGVTLGHEYCGIVAQVGNGVTGFQIGERVLGFPSIPCLECHCCRRGDTQLCNQFRRFGLSDRTF